MDLFSCWWEQERGVKLGIMSSDIISSAGGNKNVDALYYIKLMYSIIYCDS